MDPLTMALLQRQMNPPDSSPLVQPNYSTPPIAQQSAPSSNLTMGNVPTVPPANMGGTNTPPKMQRFQNAQAMIQGYRNGWNPNPVLLQAQRGK